MAANYNQKGDNVPVTAAATISSGDIVQSGAFVGVALGDALTGETVQVQVCGVFTVPVLGTDVVSQGDALYFDSANSRLTLDDATGANQLAGYAFGASGNGVTTVEVKLLY